MRLAHNLLVEVVDPNQSLCRIVQVYKSSSFHVGTLAGFKPTDATMTDDYCAACWIYLKGQDTPSKD